MQDEVNGRIGNADAITARMAAEFLPDLANQMPGLRFQVAGQAANSAETMTSILRGFLTGFVGVYLILSFQFRSHVEAVIVMLTIPLAFLGVIWGHLVKGYNISMASLVGAALLTGIVVNNAIPLVWVVRAQMREGLAAVAAAGKAARPLQHPPQGDIAASWPTNTSTQATLQSPRASNAPRGICAGSSG